MKSIRTYIANEMASKVTLVWYGFWKFLIKAEIPFTIVKLS